MTDPAFPAATADAADPSATAPCCRRCRSDVARPAVARFCPRCGTALHPLWPAPSPDAFAVTSPNAGPIGAHAPNADPADADPADDPVPWEWVAAALPAPSPAAAPLPVIPLADPVPTPPALPNALDFGRAQATAVEAIVGEWQRLRAAGVSLAPPPSAAGRDGRRPDDARPYGPRSAVVVGYANALCRLGWRYESRPAAARNVPEAVRCYLKAARLGNPDALARLSPQCAGLATTPAPTGQP
ncbi:MAG: hypothetical protein JWO31_3426 [Phycisphaerales bacterium]|nr:hypothetical protein [Phycisphaerales bacterium]